MVDNFSVELTMRLGDAASVWDRLARVEVLLGSDYKPAVSRIKWEAKDIGRSFSRSTLEDVHEAIRPFDFERTWIRTFLRNEEHCYVMITGDIAGKYSTYEVTLRFSGGGRIMVEREALSAQSALERAGYAVERGELEVSSSDEGPPAPARARVSAPSPAVLTASASMQTAVKVSTSSSVAEATPPMSAPKRVLVYLGNHVAVVVATAIGGVLTVILLAWLGLKG